MKVVPGVYSCKVPELVVVVVVVSVVLPSLVVVVVVSSVVVVCAPAKVALITRARSKDGVFISYGIGVGTGGLVWFGLCFVSVRLWHSASANMKRSRPR